MTREKKGILAIVFLLITIFLIIYIFREQISVNLPKLVKKVDLTKDSIFKKYKIKKTKLNGKDAVLFEDIISAASDSEPRYYRVNITIVTKDKKSQKKILKNADISAAVIANTLSQFKTTDVSTAKGKNFLKNTIIKNLNLKLGDETAEEIYFERFIYN